MPDVTTLVRFETSGAEGAAAGINGVAKASDNAAGSAEGAGTSFGKLKKLESIGLKVLVKDMINFSGVGGVIRPVVTMLSVAIKALVGVFGAAAAPIMAVVAVIGVLIAAKKLAAGASKAYRDELGKLLKEHEALIDGFDDAAKAGVVMTEATNEYVRSLREAVKVEAEETVAQMESERAKAEAAKTNTGFLSGIKETIGIMTGWKALEMSAIEIRHKATLTEAQLTAAIAARKKGHKDVAEEVRKEGERLKENETRLKAHATTIAKMNELVKLGTKLTPVQTAELKRLAEARTVELKVLERQIVAQIKHAKAIGSSATVIGDLEARLSAVRGGYMDVDDALAANIRDTEHLNEVAKKTADAAKEQADKTKAAWMSATSGMQSSFENFGVGMMDALRTGTTGGENLMKTFAESVIQEIERIAVKAAILSIFSSIIPGAGVAKGGLGALLGFQFGGTVPGPEGTPRMAVVHGGEQVTNPTGRGGPVAGGGGGGTTVQQTINVAGAFASMRDLQRAQRRAIRSTGELGLS